MVDQNKQLAVIEENLSVLITEKINACPKNFSKTRFLQNCLTALSEVDPVKLAKCSPMSVALTMIKGAYLGLDFANKECYAIPYGSYLQFQTDYKGDIKLARQYSVKPIKDIYAKVVREGDKFDCKIENGSPIINFTPITFNDADITGAFAVVVYEDGTMAYESMSKKEIEATRHNFSKCASSPAWQKAWGEMAKKTVLKRVTKMIEISFDNAEQTKAFKEGGDLKEEIIDISPDVKDPFKAPKTDPGVAEEAKPQKEAPAKPEPAKTPIQGDNEGAILTIQSDIEKLLISKHKEPSLIYKLSLDTYRKKLAELSLEEITGLKNKIAAGEI